MFIVALYNYNLSDTYDLSQLPILPTGRFDLVRRQGRNIVAREPALTDAFPTDKAVNEALRLVLRLAQLPQLKSS